MENKISFYCFYNKKIYPMILYEKYIYDIKNKKKLTDKEANIISKNKNIWYLKKVKDYSVLKKLPL